uniref:GCN5-related N-acetyltransferase Rv2170-like domain-containing protein n=1 Tax=Anopheles farauti TaxID=69004 RepID=A0A182QYH6_9DIPT
MEAGSDLLVEVPPRDWKAWRDLFKLDWPRHEVAYNLIDNYTTWHEHGVDLRGLKVYSLNGEWAQNGTYVIIDREEMFLYTMDSTLDTLRRMLTLVDWSQSYLINMGLYRPLVMEIYQKYELEVLFDKHTYIYYMDHEEARHLEVELPAGFKLADLDASHAKFINDEWPHKRPGSERFIEQLIRLNVNVGLFDGDGRLVAWCMRVQNGAMAMLGVAQPRRGYGSLVALGFTRKMGELGLNTYASVIECNEPPRKMFEKLGFKMSWTTDWTRNGPSERKNEQNAE